MQVGTGGGQAQHVERETNDGIRKDLVHQISVEKFGENAVRNDALSGW